MLSRSERAQYQNQYTMVVVRVADDQGNEISDYDFFLLAGKEYSPDKLPKGFFVDRQKNRRNGCQLTFYLNSTKMSQILDGKIGIRIVARPGEGFTYYTPGEFRSGDIKAAALLRGNETLLLDIELKRHVAGNTFIIEPLNSGKKDFSREKPKRQVVE
jgi:hypothetical protein